MATKKKKAAKPAKAKAKAAPKKATRKATPIAAAHGAPLAVNKVAKKVSKPRTKSDVTTILAETTGLSRKDVSLLLNNLSELISIDVGNGGPGAFNIPGLMKITRVHKPATKARKGINPFTKEPMTFKAKPARNVVRIRPLKALKDKVM